MHGRHLGIAIDAGQGEIIADVIHDHRCLEEILPAFLQKLAHGMKVRGHLQGSRENAAAFFAAALAEKLLEPFGEIAQFAVVHFKDLHRLALFFQ